MIVSLDKIKQQIKTDLPDPVLKDKLKALEQIARKYTNNNFQVRARRTVCSIVDGKLQTAKPIFSVGDTVEISESLYNNGVYTVISKDGKTVELEEDLLDEAHALITLVRYPADVQQGVINLMKWDLEYRDKVGIASETLSRHSVTYFDMNGENSVMGFPSSLMGFLKGYRKARF